MKQFILPEIRTIKYSARDIISTSEETAESTSATGTTDNDGSIITPPDEFDHD